MTSTFLVLSAIQTEWNSDIIADQDSCAILANGILFNNVTKILLAEKFINVDFLAPFPKFEMNVSAELGAYINKLAPLWAVSSWQCHLDYSTNFQRNDSTFDIDWLQHQVENEVTLAEKELEALRIFTSEHGRRHRSSSKSEAEGSATCNDGARISRTFRTRNSFRQP